MIAPESPVITPPCLLEMSAEEYHADTIGPLPTLSASCATTIVTRSPLHAFLQHPRLGGRKREVTAAMERGTLLHSLLLGAGAEIVTLDFDNYKTKAAQEARDHARACGAVPMLAREKDEIDVMVDAIRANLDTLGFKLDGASERVAVWEEQSTHGPVLCRGMMDHLFLEQGIILDLKTARSAHPHDIARHMVAYGCDVQWAAYTSALRHLRPDLAGREQMLFLFVEAESPYCVTPVRPDGSMRELGQMRWGRAVETWSRCWAAQYWPPYATSIIGVEAPTWALNQEENAEVEASDFEL